MPKNNTNQKSSKDTNETNLSGARLHRSETNRVIAGVCGGLGDYFNIDPTIIRIIFILMTIFGGSGILIYIILWLVIPTESSIHGVTEQNIRENANEMKAKVQKFAPASPWLGFFIVIIGMLFLLNSYGYLDLSEGGKLWPIILIIFGIFILLRK